MKKAGRPTSTEGKWTIKDMLNYASQFYNKAYIIQDGYNYYRQQVKRNLDKLEIAKKSDHDEYEVTIPIGKFLIENYMQDTFSNPEPAI